MQARTLVAAWPPRVGDYARLRPVGTLGESAEVAGCYRDRRYTLNLFGPSRGAPVICGLEDFEPAWPVWTQETGANSLGEPVPAAWSLPQPHWVRA